MAAVNQPTNLVDRIAGLEQQVRELRAKVGLSSATVSRGGLTVQDGAEFRVLHPSGHYLLAVTRDEHGAYQYVLGRSDGAIAQTVQSHADGVQFWAGWDRGGHVILSDDAAAGVGLARPWLPVPLQPMFSMSASSVWGYMNLAHTEIASETPLWIGTATISHPRITVTGVWGPASGTNTTTYRLRVGGTEVGSWTVSTLETSTRGPFDCAAWTNQDNVAVELSADNTSGTGQVACHLLSCYLRQS